VIPKWQQAATFVHPADTCNGEDAAGYAHLPRCTPGVNTPDGRTAMNLPKHKFWGAGEPDCPADLKAPNGELHSMRCKVCGDDWRKSGGSVCMEALIGIIRELPFVNAPEIDGEKSDGTPRYYHSRRYVSLIKLERLLRSADGVSVSGQHTLSPTGIDGAGSKAKG
jgi:hypothetical protein